MKRSNLLLHVSVSVLISGIVPSISYAQDDRPGDVSAGLSENEILVTARKRNESDLVVPVAIVAMGRTQLDRLNIQSLGDVAAATPSLNIVTNTGFSGGSITLRGVGSPATSAGTDQAVALNLDGVTISDGLAIRFGQFDLERVEVLQGPQSLYYGKNASGGIISVVSANPTSKPYAMLRGGYTFESRGWLTEAVLSGPLANGLTARLALYRNDQKGFFRNALTDSTVVPPAGLLAIYGPLLPPKYRRGPDTVDTGIRGTIKFEPNEDLSIRLKGAFLDHRGSTTHSFAHLFYCPAGVPAPGNPGNVPGIAYACKLDRTALPFGQSATAAVGGDPRFGDGSPINKTKQYLAVGDINYDMSEILALNSVTGYYKHTVFERGNSTLSPYPGIGSVNDITLKQFSQEFRLTTSSDGPFNGMAGLYYQSGDFALNNPVTVVQSIFPRSDFYFDSHTYSAFGQLTYKPMQSVEISAGARYTDEKKHMKLFSNALNAFATDLPVDTVHSKRFMPELAVSWRPDRQINVFLTYKRGAKSGGFSANVLALPPYADDDLAFADETVNGFEGGVKSILLDGALRFDLTGYTYTYKDLQVNIFEPSTASFSTRNAASAKVRGIQLTANYSPRQIPGFNLSGSLNYGHARYGNYLAPCYTGQTIAAGCNLDAFGNVVATGGINQNLGGRPTSAAPDWSGNLSANYDLPVTSGGTRIGLSLGATYTGRQNPLPALIPQAWQRSVVILDGQLRLFNDDRGWELALIGKNLTNELRAQWGVENAFTPGFGVNPGTGTTGPGVQSDLLGYSNDPFHVMIRLTIKPWDFFSREK